MDSSGGVRPAPAPRFVPGDVFAGRYRMVTMLAARGMGEVWQADDLILQAPVALKLIHIATPDVREQTLEEVRLARELTHPAICRVFDVGEADGDVFYSMEFVEGEDLGTLRGRAGRFPSEKVVEIGRQLCDGIAAAHARGVLHRDLRPANVLVDQDGRVRITDFGMVAPPRGSADPRADAYLAPEQRSSGAVSERTDVFAIGLLLYELLTGHLPLTVGTTGPPPRPSTLVAEVDPVLERAVLKALEPDPAKRPPSAEALGALLTTPARSRAGAWIWLAAAALVVIAALVAPFVLPRGANALTDRDTIIVADVMNTTGETVFDGTLKVALEVALEQSPFLNVFPGERVRETLRLMGRPDNTAITRAVARDVARREGVKALIAGSIGPLGRNYVLALEAVNAETGDVIAREQVEITAKEQVLTSLGEAVSRLREKLGESLTSISRFDAPLPRATTTSLEALHAYALALDNGRVNPRVEAIPHLTRAIELDPNFAMAHALMSAVYANTGRSADAPQYARRAFELRDRVSERERFFLSWRYYVDAQQAWDRALEVARSWTTTYPREAFAFNSLGLASAAFGQHGRAVDAFREAIRLDARFVPPHGNLVGSLIASNRFDEARSLLAEATTRGIDGTGLRRAAYTLAFIADDRPAMQQALARGRQGLSALEADSWEARTALFSGRFALAHDLFRRGVDGALSEGASEVAAQWTVEDAEAHALAGDCATAQRETSAGLELARDSFTLQRASRVLALCGDGAASARLVDELSTRFPEATLTSRIQLPVSAAALAVQRRDPERALALLDPVRPYDQAPSAEFWPTYLRGQAYLQAGQASAALQEFQGIVDRRGVAPTSPLYALAHLGAARAASRIGDGSRARPGYERFLELWRGADPNLAYLRDARAEYARVR